MALSAAKLVALPRTEASTSKTLQLDKSQLREAEHVKLRKATREFEALFSYYMLKAMRQTVGASDDKNKGVLSSGLGKDTFTEMFDMKMSEKMTTRGKHSIAETMYKQMVKNIDGKDAEHPLNTSLQSARTRTNHAIAIESSQQKSESTPRLEHIAEPAATHNNQIRPMKEVSLKRFEAEPFSFDFTPEATTAPVTHVISEPVEPHPSISTSGQSEKHHRRIYERYGNLIDKASRLTSLDSSLIASVIHAESSGNPSAVSSAGAKGLMQLMDSTSARYDVAEPFDPEENITAGSKYLRDLIDRFGDVKLALAAYNAGPTNVVRYNGIPPFPETVSYVEKIMTAWGSGTETTQLSAAKVNMPIDR